MPTSDMKPHDEINPDHYKAADGSEVIDVIELYDLDFHIGNALKYMLRAGKKLDTAAVTDLEKAIWYLQREIKVLSPEEEDSKAAGVPLAEGKTSGPVLSGGLSK